MRINIQVKLAICLHQTKETSETKVDNAVSVCRLKNFLHTSAKCTLRRLNGSQRNAKPASSGRFGSRLFQQVLEQQGSTACPRASLCKRCVKFFCQRYLRCKGSPTLQKWFLWNHTTTFQDLWSRKELYDWTGTFFAVGELTYHNEVTYEVCFLYFLLLALTVPHVNTNEPHQVTFLFLSPVFLHTLESFKKTSEIILILGI